MVLYPEQRQMVSPYFEGVTESAVLISKKNGKSSLVAALALYHLLVTPDAECIIVAAAREQAEVVLRQARGIIGRSPALRGRMRVMRREIQSLEDQGRIRVLASDEDTADGVLPTLAIVDELHRHKTSELYAVLRLGLGARKGRMVTISTAGATMASPLGELRRRAYEMPGFHRDERRKRSSVRSASGAFAFEEWCLDPGDDPTDMRLVKLVNPAPWRDAATLAAEQESITPWQWLRLVCGVWTEGEEPWIEPAKWDALASDEALEPGEDVWLGVELGVRTEASAVAIVARRGERFVVGCRFVPPVADEASFGHVEAKVVELAGVFGVQAVVHDPFSFKRSASILADEHGLEVVEHPQSVERMAQASAVLYRAIETQNLAHDGDPTLRAHVLAGITKQTERGWRLAKDPKRPRPIAGLIGLAMATHVASLHRPTEIMVAWR